MNVTDAAYATVHDYPGGSESLAPRMGMSAAVLRNKVNPHNPRNQLSLTEADQMLELTGDHRVLHAMAGKLDYVLARTKAADDDTDNVVSLVLHTSTASGKLAHSICEAMADGIITEREMLAISDAGLSNQRIIMDLVARLQDMAAKRPVTP